MIHEFGERALALLRRSGEATLQSRVDGVGMARALLCVRAPAGGAATAAASPESIAALARWIEELHATAVALEPRALEIAGLALAGWDDRDIAAKLDLGPRLVARIRRALNPHLRGLDNVYRRGAEDAENISGSV